VTGGGRQTLPKRKKGKESVRLTKEEKRPRATASSISPGKQEESRDDCPRETAALWKKNSGERVRGLGSVTRQADEKDSIREGNSRKKTMKTGQRGRFRVIVKIGEQKRAKGLGNMGGKTGPSNGRRHIT